MLIQNAIEQLKSYNGPDELKLHDGADEALISELEKMFDTTFPDDFKTFYRFTDGFETDEDIFNMVPLADMREQRHKYDSPLNIAEYMIYSDMWALKINPYNCNDYQIIHQDEYGDDFVVTNSLGEFISRFLKGGVFGNDGLYDWHDEVRAEDPYNPINLKPLLKVFYNGLTNGIISKEQVISWADNIIRTESEPDNFFIEVSLGHDLDGVITAISVIPVSDSCLSTRALSGILYLSLLNEIITVDKAFAVMDDPIFVDKLTLVESKSFRDIEYSYFIYDDEFDYVKAREAMLAFLARYKDFTLQNYNEWAKINKDINIALGPENAKLTLINNQAQVDALDRTKSNTRSRLIKITVAIVLIALLGFWVMKFSPQSLTIFIIILSINIVRVISEYKKK
jgi:cell wall assembly regulator SMI1